MGPERPEPPVEEPVTPDAPPTIPEPRRPVISRAQRRALQRAAARERKKARREWLAAHDERHPHP